MWHSLSGSLYQDVTVFLSAHQALDGDIIEHFADHLNWSKAGLSGNNSLPWSIALIKRFEDRWVWTSLSKNVYLPWSIELIAHFEGRWDWNGVKQWGWEFEE